MRQRQFDFRKGRLPANPNLHRLRRYSAMILAASVACVQWTPEAQGATETWTAGSSNWSTAANWNSGAGPVPGAGDTVDITNDDSTTPTITYDYTGSAVTLNTVTVDNNGGGIDTLSMAANDALSSDYRVCRRLRQRQQWNRHSHPAQRH